VNYSGALSDEQYHAAMRRIDEIFDAEAGSNEIHELDLLVDVVECHENTTLGDAVKFARRMRDDGILPTKERTAATTTTKATYKPG